MKSRLDFCRDYVHFEIDVDRAQGVVANLCWQSPHNESRKQHLLY
jgi:hypothetical protein